MGEDSIELHNDNEHRGAGKDQEQKRGWEAYKRFLKFPNDFAMLIFLGGTAEEPNRVLDIGAGKARFANECRERVPNVKVIAVDPQYKDKDYIKDLPEGVEYVTGSWDSLPLEDESVDRVVSAGAFPLWCRQEEWPEALGEIKRILKQGGKARFKMPPRTVEFRQLLDGDDSLECFYQSGTVTITKKQSSK